MLHPNTTSNKVVSFSNRVRTLFEQYVGGPFIQWLTRRHPALPVTNLRQTAKKFDRN